MLLLASSAAEPTPSSASFSAFSPFAADTCALQLFPDSIPKNFAIAVTTCARMLTSFTKTGITTSRIGCASVKRAAFRRAIDARAASFCMIVWLSQLRSCDKPREMTVKNSARLNRFPSLRPNLSMLFSTLADTSAILAEAPLAFVICCTSSPALVFATSSASVWVITLSVIFAY